MKVLAFILTMTFTGALFARGIEHDRFDHFETLREMRQQQKSQAKKQVPKELDGRVRCANDSHSKNGNCDLEFVTKSGDVLDIDENMVLGKRHCKNHKDLMVKLTAMVHPKFLFWGGGLDVKSYDVLKEVEPVKLKKAHPNRFEHLDRFDIGINI